MINLGSWVVNPDNITYIWKRSDGAGDVYFVGGDKLTLDAERMTMLLHEIANKL